MAVPEYQLPCLWCPECEHSETAPGKTYCPKCRKYDRKNVPLKTLAELTPPEMHVVRLRAWNRAVWEQDLQGLSPGGAAGELGCHRSMIDKLVDTGVLEKSVFDEMGQFIVYISLRSIRWAKESKRQTGKWTKIVKGEDATKQ